MVLAGCAGPRAASSPGPFPEVPALAPASYAFSMEARVAVEAEEPEQAWQVHWSMSGRVRLLPREIFRDGSLGFDLLFEDLSVEGQPEFPLAGRALRIRRFDDGELLSVGELGHVLGPVGALDTLDMLVIGLFPQVPFLEPDEERGVRRLWPFRVSQDRYWRTTQHGQWENLGETEGRWHFRYAGPTQTTGRDGEHGELEGRGQGQGEVWVEAQTGDLQRHEYQWSHVRDHRAGSQVLHQAADFEGAVWVVPEAEAVVLPPTLYLEERAVVEILHGATEEMGACRGQEADGLWSLHGHLSREGRLVAPGLVPGSAEDTPEGRCLLQVVEELQFPTHYGSPMVVGYSLVWREGRLQRYPQATLEPLPTSPLGILPEPLSGGGEGDTLVE